jgi:hypothetical protein
MTFVIVTDPPSQDGAARPFFSCISCISWFCLLHSYGLAVSWYRPKAGERGRPEPGSREGERTVTEPSRGNLTDTQRSENVSPKPRRIAHIARQRPQERRTAWNHYLDVEWLTEACPRGRRNGAPGGGRAERRRVRRALGGQPSVAAAPGQARHVGRAAGQAGPPSQGWVERNPSPRDAADRGQGVAAGGGAAPGADPRGNV